MTPLVSIDIGRFYCCPCFPTDNYPTLIMGRLFAMSSDKPFSGGGMERQIYLAYDGSIKCRLGSPRYAIRIAATFHNRRIILIHILDHSASRRRIDEKIAAIARECEVHGIECRSVIHDLDRDVFPACSGLSLPATTVTACAGRGSPPGAEVFSPARSRSDCSARGCSMSWPSGWSTPA